MFSILSPSPPPENFYDEAQVVPLSEHSTALNIAFRHIYLAKTTPERTHYIVQASLPSFHENIK